MGRRQQQANTTELLQDIAARIAEAAPEGWRQGRVRVQGSEDGASHYGSWYELADGDTGSMNLDLLGDARKVHFATRPVALREDVAAVLAPMGLRLSRAKTQVVHMSDGFRRARGHLRTAQLCRPKKAPPSWDGAALRGAAADPARRRGRGETGALAFG